MKIVTLSAATAAAVTAAALLTAAQAQDKAQDKEKEKSLDAQVLDAGAKIRDIQDAVNQATKAGKPLPREKAGIYLAELTDIRNGPLFEKLPAQRKTQITHASVYCRLCLGRAKEALDGARNWVEADDKDGYAWSALFDAAAGAGDPKEYVRAYAHMLEGIQLIPAGEKQVDVKSLNAKDKEPYDAKQKKLREDTAKVQAKIFSPVGKKAVASFGVGFADGTGKFAWKKGGGKALVIGFWGTKLGALPPVQDTYRGLHEIFGDDDRVQFLGVWGFLNAGDRAAEFDAALKAPLPGAATLDQVTLPGSLYNRMTGNLGAPLLWVVSPGGTVAYSASPGANYKTTVRQAAYAMLAALQAEAEKAGKAAGVPK
jgi:hypothetical protein